MYQCTLTCTYVRTRTKKLFFKVVWNSFKLFLLIVHLRETKIKKIYIHLGAGGPCIYPIIPYIISFQKSITWTVLFTFHTSRKTGRTQTGRTWLWFSLLKACSDLKATNVFSVVVEEFKFPLVTYFSTIEVYLYSLSGLKSPHRPDEDK